MPMQIHRLKSKIMDTQNSCDKLGVSFYKISLLIFQFNPQLMYFLLMEEEILSQNPYCNIDVIKTSLVI